MKSSPFEVQHVAPLTTYLSSRVANLDGRFMSACDVSSRRQVRTDGCIAPAIFQVCHRSPPAVRGGEPECSDESLIPRPT